MFILNHAFDVTESLPAILGYFWMHCFQCRQQFVPWSVIPHLIYLHETQ